MAYRFERDFATIQDGVRHLALELIDDAVACAGSKGKNVHETVHSMRKSCKKLRGLIRLVRPVFDEYRTENGAFRDAGRDLSVLRDGGVLVETYDSLLGAYAEQIERSQFAPIRRRLTALQRELADHADVPEMMDEFRRTMAKARKRARDWSIADDGFDAIEPGVRKSYKRAQRAMADVSKEPTPEAVHEWRKRVKDHWYQARLLAPIWRKPMEAHGDVADKLGDLLGKHHDLEVFQQRLGEDKLGGAGDVDVLAGLARRRQKAIEDDALSIGARLLVEPVESLARRWRLYWDAWREEKPREAVLAA